MLDTQVKEQQLLADGSDAVLLNYLQGNYLKSLASIMSIFSYLEGDKCGFPSVDMTHSNTNIYTYVHLYWDAIDLRVTVASYEIFVASHHGLPGILKVLKYTNHIR